MASDQPGDSLSFQDTVFVHLERPHMPLHIGVVEIFDGGIRLDRLQRFIESRLGDIPRYTQKLEMPPLKMAHPRWVPDTHFDIRRHVRRAKLEHGTAKELQELAGDVFSRVMDRKKPLWDLTLVEGFEGGLTPIIWRVHHCLVDGIAGVSLMKTLMDPSPSPPPRRTARFHPPAEDAPERPLADTLLSSCFEFTEGLISVASAGLHFAQGLAAGGIAQSAAAWQTLLPELLTPPEPLPFNKTCAGISKFVWTQMPLGEIAAIRAAGGGTINDVALAVLTSAVQRYTAAHKQDIHRSVRVMVPVNTRGPENMSRMGVDISLVPVDLPLGIEDPLLLLKAVESTTRLLKSAHMNRAFSLVSAWLSALPGPAKPFAGWLLSNPLPVLPWNVNSTNVPGPAEPLYLLGRKMVACYPFLPVIPLGTRTGLSCAFYSYDGQLYCGIAADVAAMPDVDRFHAFMEQAYAELRDAAANAGVPAKPPAAAKRRRAAKAKRAAASTALR